MNWEPRPNTVILEYVTQSGLVLPEGVTSGAKLIVAAVGPEIEYLDVGDEVKPHAMQTHSARQFTEDKRTFLVCHINDIAVRRKSE